MDEERRLTPYRDAAATFGALLLALLLAGAAAMPFAAVRPWVGSGLYVVLVVAYGSLTRTGRDTGFGFYVVFAFAMPLTYLLWIVAVLVGLPETFALRVFDVTSLGLNVGLCLNGGADAPYDIILALWALSMVPLTLLAGGAQQWMVMRRDDWPAGP